MINDEQRDLWAAIRSAPEEDAPRLLYADWLEEQGQIKRAELIRVQCALAVLGSDRRSGRKQRAVLEPQEKALLEAHGDRWLTPFQQILPTERLGFCRGFVGRKEFGLHLGLAAARRLAETGDTLEPVDQLHVLECCANYCAESVAAIARWEGAGSILEFSIAGGADRDIDEIVCSPYLRNLHCLRVFMGNVTDEGVAQLAAWPFAATLDIVDLKENPIGDVGAFALADSPYLGDLYRLDLYQTQIGPAGEERLRERFNDAVQI